MLISIETHRTYNFTGGGGCHFIVSTYMEVLTKYCINSDLGFAEIVQSESSTHYELFLKSYCLLWKKRLYDSSS